MKAEWLQLGWKLEKTHDLERLLQGLAKQKSSLVTIVTPLCDELADVYFTDRYPGFDLDDPEWPKLREQVAGVTALLEAVKAKVPEREESDLCRSRDHPGPDLTGPVSV